MVISKIRIKLNIQRHVKKPIKFDATLLKLPHIASKFKQAVEDKLKTNLMNTDIDNKLKIINDAMVAAGNESLVAKKGRSASWISANTLELVMKRRQLPRHQRNQRYLIDRAIKDSLKADKDDYWQKVAKDLEDANLAGNTRKLYEILRKCTGKTGSGDCPIMRNDGTVATQSEDKLERWSEHFSALLNAGTLDHESIPQQYLTAIPQSLNCNIEAPSTDEIARAIGRLKNRKSPGEDNIPPEFYKVACTELLVPLKSLFEQM
jgi:hypothetical protein